MASYVSVEIIGDHLPFFGLTYSRRSFIVALKLFFVSLCRFEMAMRAARIA